MLGICGTLYHLMLYFTSTCHILFERAMSLDLGAVLFLQFRRLELLLKFCRCDALQLHERKYYSHKLFKSMHSQLRQNIVPAHDPRWCIKLSRGSVVVCTYIRLVFIRILLFYSKEQSQRTRACLKSYQIVMKQAKIKQIT